MACRCVYEIQDKIKKALGVDNGVISNKDIMSGRTYSTFQYNEPPKKEGGRPKKKEQLMLHSYCPYCGKEYKEEKDTNQ